MAKTLCHTVTVTNQYPVELHQTGFDQFSVIYGKQVKTDLNYSAAALEFGACVMHALACDGRLDNRDRAEARAAGDRKPYFQAA